MDCFSIVYEWEGVWGCGKDNLSIVSESTVANLSLNFKATIIGDITS